MVIVKTLYRSLKFVLQLMNLIKNYLYVKLMKVHISFNSIKNINGTIFIRNQGYMYVGKNVKINSSYRSNPIGGNCFTSIVVIQEAELIIGEGTGISNSAIVCHNKINIGKNVFIGGDCKIYDTDFHSLNFEKRISTYDDDINSAPINIKEGAFIGSGCIILKGVTIGEKSVIGAGSVVTKNIPSNEIWAGNPVKFIRKIQYKGEK